MTTNIIIAVVFVALVCVIDFSEFFLDEDTEKLIYLPDEEQINQEMSSESQESQEQTESQQQRNVQQEKTVQEDMDLDDFIEPEEEEKVQEKKSKSRVRKRRISADAVMSDTDALAEQLIKDVMQDTKRG